MVNLNLFSENTVFKNDNGIAAIGIIVELEETHRYDIEVLLICQTNVAIRLRIIKPDPIPLYLLDQVRIINDAWLGSDMVCEVTPLAHPLY